MARKKLSEYRAKHIVTEAIAVPYEGWEVAVGEHIPNLSSERTYVVKVDQAVKQRFKKGLIALDVAADDVASTVTKLAAKGFEHFLIEPFRTYEENERYIALKRERDGIIVSYSAAGGVEIETHADSIVSILLDDAKLEDIAKETGFSVEQLGALRNVFDEAYLSLLEINPYIVSSGRVDILDAAIEVDSAAESFVSQWSEHDIRSAVKLSPEEVVVRKLNDDSPASLSLEVINPDGGVFLMLSGGGASVVIADEVFSLGKGDQLANYGEYSGNPNEEETRIYTEQVISLLLKSRAKKKVLLIGGAVANFTDIATTFSGVISALEKHGAELKKQNVTVYVRRGGPRQQIGLKRIKETLENIDILGGVYDPKTSIPTAVKHLLEGL